MLERIIFDTERKKYSRIYVLLENDHKRYVGYTYPKKEDFLFQYMDFEKKNTSTQANVVSGSFLIFFLCRYVIRSACDFSSDVWQ